MVIIGSPNVNPGYILVGNQKYPKIADDYVKTFAVLKGLPCDVFLGAHGAYFGMKAKYEKMKAGGGNAYRSGGLSRLRCGAGKPLSGKNGIARSRIRVLRQAVSRSQFTSDRGRIQSVL